MKKVLLYGNCQLSRLDKYLFSQSPLFSLLKPEDYGAEVKENWQKNLFFPANIKKNSSLYDAISDCDYFIFQHVHGEQFVTHSKELYDCCESEKLCLPNFRFSLNEPSQNKEDIKELKARASTNKDLYGENHIDLSNWIESKHERWGEFYQLTEKHHSHPSGLYYNKLSKEIIKKLNLNLKPLSKDILYHP
tara:strand:- start:1054 stop:1626 length:573 start_codon:yes stop_codon:yes gene_type:complete